MLKTIYVSRKSQKLFTKSSSFKVSLVKFQTNQAGEKYLCESNTCMSQERRNSELFLCPNQRDRVVWKVIIPVHGKRTILVGWKVVMYCTDVIILVAEIQPTLKFRTLL
jgi:hypothetical protein